MFVSPKNSAKNLIPLTGPPEALLNFCFCPHKTLAISFEKSPILPTEAARGHLRPTSRPTSRPKSRPPRPTSRPLRPLKVIRGHSRLLKATNKPGIYETNLEEGLVTLNNLEEGLVTLNNLEEDLVTQQFRRRFGDSKQKVPTTN